MEYLTTAEFAKKNGESLKEEWGYIVKKAD